MPRWARKSLQIHRIQSSLVTPQVIFRSIDHRIKQSSNRQHQPIGGHVSSRGGGLYVVIKRGVNILWVTEKQWSKFYVAKAGRVKILWKLKYGDQNSIFSRGTLGQNSMFPEKGGQNSIFFPSALKKGGQNRGAYQPTSLKGCPPPGVSYSHTIVLPRKPFQYTGRLSRYVISL